MVKNQKKTFSAHFEASIQEVKEKDAEIEMMKKKIRISEDQNMVLREEVKALKELRDRDIDPYLEDSAEETEEEEKDEEQTEEEEKDEEQTEEQDEYEGDEDEAETDESELTSSSYSQNMDSPEEMPEDDDDEEEDSGVEEVEEEDSVPVPIDIEEEEYDVPIKELLGGLSPPRSSSRCSSSRSSSPAQRPWTPTDSTVECRRVCGPTCQLSGSESSKHKASIPPILQFSDYSSSDSNSSVKIIEKDE